MVLQSSPHADWKHEILSLVFKFHLHHCPSLSSSPVLQSPADLSCFSRATLYPLGGLRSAILCHGLPSTHVAFPMYCVVRWMEGSSYLWLFQVSSNVPPNPLKQFNLLQFRWLGYFLPWVLLGVLKWGHEVHLFVCRPSLAQWIIIFF